MTLTGTSPYKHLTTCNNAEEEHIEIKRHIIFLLLPENATGTFPF
jgi:hypothetical protein